MPVVTTTTPGIFTVNDLALRVVYDVENRVQDIQRAWQWVVDALLELSANPDFRDDFTQLEVFGPQYNLTMGQQEYPDTNFLPAGNINRSTLDIMVWEDYPTNSIRRRLDWTNFQDTDRFQTSFLSLPMKAYRFAGNIGFYPVPNVPYQTQSRALIYHPINYESLGATVILLPQDWMDVLVYAADERGWNSLEEFDKAAAIHNMLHGDPKRPNEPGMIYSRKKQRINEMWRAEMPLQPAVRSYSFGSRRF